MVLKLTEKRLKLTNLSDKPRLFHDFCDDIRIYLLIYILY